MLDPKAVADRLETAVREMRISTGAALWILSREGEDQRLRFLLAEAERVPFVGRHGNPHLIDELMIEGRSEMEKARIGG